MFPLPGEHTYSTIVRLRLRAGRSFDWGLESLASLLDFFAVGTAVEMSMAATASKDCRQES